jgi:hypothetical protein
VIVGVVVAAIAGAVFTFLVAWGAWSARRQRRVLGRSRYRDCLATTRILRRFSGRLQTLSGLMWLAVAGGVSLLWYQWTSGGSLLLSLAGLALLVTGLGQWARERVPASLLVLGGSGEEQIALQAAIRDAVLPFRPVSLLQTGVLRVDVRIPGDCFRIDRGIDWREAVSGLSRSVAIIVLDTRNLTPFVREEIAHLAEAGHAHKTLLIGSEGAAGLLDRGTPRSGGAPTTSACRVADSELALGLIRNLLLEREVLPTKERPIALLAQEWAARREGPAPATAAVPRSGEPERGRPVPDAPAPVAPPDRPAPEAPRIRPRCERLAPFSYRPPPGWQTKVLAEGPDQYAALFRPPEESGGGLLSVLRRRSRLDLMVFKYTDETITDEAAFRAATERNLTGRGATITRERMGRRCGVTSHECEFQRGVSHGHLVRFIARGNEFVVHWAAMDGPTMQRHLGEVEAFAGGIET